MALLGTLSHHDLQDEGILTDMDLADVDFITLANTMKRLLEIQPWNVKRFHSAKIIFMESRNQKENIKEFVRRWSAQSGAEEE